MEKTYKVDLSLTNIRTLRLKRDLALKQEDYDLANAYSLRLKMLGYVGNYNRKTIKRKDNADKNKRTRETTD